MGGWIKFDKDMAQDPRLVQAAQTILERMIIATKTQGGGGIDMSHGDASRIVTHALRGALVTLWCYADEHVRDDDSLPCDVTALDAIIGLDGFCDALPDEWLTINDDGFVVLPGYCAKNSLVSKRKKSSKSADRQRRYRERLKASRDASVTHSVTRNASDNGCVTEGGDQDPDQDIKNTTAALRPAPPEFEEFKAAFPKRAGNQPWRRALKAASARVSEGHDWGELISGARRYSAWCTATSKVGTEHVMQAATFCGPDKPFLQTWESGISEPKQRKVAF